MLEPLRSCIVLLPQVVRTDVREVVSVSVAYVDPVTLEPGEATWEGTIGELLLEYSPRLIKGRAVVAYANTLEAIRWTDPEQADELLSQAIDEVTSASDSLGEDQDLEEIAELLELYRQII